MIEIGSIVFGHWVVDDKIGSGAFGTVYKLKRNEFGTEYKSALKVITIPPENTDYSDLQSEGMSKKEISTYYADIAMNFLEEIKILEDLKGNSNIVSYDDHIIEQGEDGLSYTIMIRMELLTPLKEILSKKALDKDEVITLGVDICNALELCEKKKIIHRDIKPDNIFVSNTGAYKLGDFGVARTMEKTASAMSQKGTYTYMAPEVFLGKKYDNSVDLYSLGILLYQLLNDNRAPFLPLAPQPIKYTDRETAQQRRMSGEVIPDIENLPKAWNAFLRKACSYTSKERFASASEMKKALESLRGPNDGEMHVPNEIHIDDESEKEKKAPVAVTEDDEDDEKTASAFDSLGGGAKKNNHPTSVSVTEDDEDDEKTTSAFDSLGGGAKKNDHPTSVPVTENDEDDEKTTSAFDYKFEKKIKQKKEPKKSKNKDKTKSTTEAETKQKRSKKKIIIICIIIAVLLITAIVSAILIFQNYDSYNGDYYNDDYYNDDSYNDDSYNDDSYNDDSYNDDSYNDDSYNGPIWYSSLSSLIGLNESEALDKLDQEVDVIYDVIYVDDSGYEQGILCNIVADWVYDEDYGDYYLNGDFCEIYVSSGWQRCTDEEDIPADAEVENLYKSYYVDKNEKFLKSCCDMCTYEEIIECHGEELVSADYDYGYSEDVITTTYYFTGETYLGIDICGYRYRVNQ